MIVKISTRKKKKKEANNNQYFSQRLFLVSHLYYMKMIF
jgi:hypothetical protein